TGSPKRAALRETADVAPAPPPSVVAPAPPPAVVAPAFQAGPSDRADGLETRIGSRWLLYAGVVAIVVGISYFEKLAIDNNWLSETARVVQGAIAGVALIATGMRVARIGYRAYGQILAGTGISILYVSTYAAFNFYHLIPQTTAFTLMTLVTIAGASLAA